MNSNVFQTSFKVRCILFCTAFLLLLLPCDLFSQDLVYRHYFTEDGLSSPEVYMTMQDKEGHIWISTDNGVLRFDGYEFKNYTTDDGLNNNTVFGTLEDDDGRIWFFTFSAGISYFKDGRFHKPLGDDFGDLWYGSSVPYSFVMDSDTLYIGMRISKKQDGTFIKLFDDSIHEPNSFKSSRPSGAIVRLKGGNYIASGFPSEKMKIINTDDLFLTLVDTTGKETHFQPDVFIDSLTSFSTFQRANGDILFTYYGDLCLWSGDSITKLSEIGAATNLGLFEDSRGDVWVALKGGGVLLYPKGDFSSPPQKLFNDVIISWINEDREGSIWISTLKTGVFYIPSVHVFQLPAAAMKNDRLIDIEVKEDTVLILGQSGNVFRLIYEGGRLKEMFSKKLLDFGHKLKWEKDSLPEVWGRGPDPILGEFSPKTLEFGNIESNVRAMGRIASSDTSFLLVAMAHGRIEEVNKSDLDNPRVLYKTKKHRWRSRFVESKRIWLGGLNSLSRFDLETSRLVEVLPNEDLLRVAHRCMNKLGGNLLIGTSGKGLVVMDTETEEIHSINKQHGLSGNICNDVFVDAENVIWVATNKGVSSIRYVDSSDFEVKNFDFLSSSISKRAIKVRVEKGIVWVLFDDGVIYFDKNKYQEPSPPKVYIDLFEVNHKASSIDIEEKKFDWNENNVRFVFKGMSLRVPKDLKYRYRLKGQEEYWNYSEDRSVTYSSLRPGKYEFQVMAQNFSGEWGAETTSQKFQILKPWWRLWWFRMLEVVLIIMFLISGAYFYSRRLQRKAQAQKKIDELKLQALQAQMNPHFVFNVLGAIQSFISSKDILAAQEYLASFATLIRATLNHSVKNWVVLDEEIEVLKTYITLEAMRFETPFSYALNIDPALMTDEIEIPSMLMQPFIENSIIHGLAPLKGKGHLQIDMVKKGESILCSIVDNGVGRHFAKSQSNNKNYHKSYGIKITKERLQLIDDKKDSEKYYRFYDLKNRDGSAKGTKVVVIIPFK